MRANILFHEFLLFLSNYMPRINSKIFHFNIGKCDQRYKTLDKIPWKVTCSSNQPGNSFLNENT